MPEVVGNMRACSLLRQHARPQRLVQYIQQRILVHLLAGTFQAQRADNRKLEGAAQNGGVAQQQAAEITESAQAMVERSGDCSRQRRRRCARQFLCKERVAGGAILNVTQHRLRQVGDVRNQHPDLLAGQWAISSVITECSRNISAIRWRNGESFSASSFSRHVAMSRTGRLWMRRARWASNWQLPTSAHCTSSSTMTNGLVSLAVASS